MSRVPKEKNRTAFAIAFLRIDIELTEVSFMIFTPSSADNSPTTHIKALHKKQIDCPALGVEADSPPSNGLHHSLLLSRNSPPIKKCSYAQKNKEFRQFFLIYLLTSGKIWSIIYTSYEKTLVANKKQRKGNLL